MKADRQRNSTERCTQEDRGDHKRGIPDHDARDFERSHAGVMHGGDAAGNDSAADPACVAPIRDKRNRQSRACQQNGRYQRQDGQGDVIAARNSRREREHGHEVRRPNAESGGYGRYADPDLAHLIIRSHRVTKQIYRGERCQCADQGGQRHEPEIVRVDDTTIDLQHVTIPQRRKWPLRHRLTVKMKGAVKPASGCTILRHRSGKVG